MNTLWSLLLVVKEYADHSTLLIDKIEFISFPDEVTIKTGDHIIGYFRQDQSLKTGRLAFKRLSPFRFEVTLNEILNTEELSFLGNYLPYSMLGNLATKTKRCYSITHFAQSLDGRICMPSGDSKWIGNQENLVHAHRMRALCDGIMVGKKTYIRDNPQLNVRHVNGKDPVKIIVGELSEDLIPLVKGPSFFISQNHENLIGADKKIRLKKKRNEYSPQDILISLYQRSVRSLYIEGGAYTTSCFLKHNCIDQLQVHYSPKILGKGTTGFNLPTMRNMNGAITFEHHQFMKMGEEIMFVGEPKKK